MDGSTNQYDKGEDSSTSPWLQAERPALDVLRPVAQTIPLVMASPHSGALYPPTFLAQSRLDPATLRKSEDSFVDELLLPATANGIPLLRANFPRAYVDVNREPFELDPRMFEDPLPDYVTTRSPRITAGLGTIARVVASGYDIYARKLRFAEAAERIGRCYRPYHDSLSALIAETRQRLDGLLVSPAQVYLGCEPDIRPVRGVLRGDVCG
jgi:N-formylglutamate amidohydrolase